jgi:hypothetical protein
MRITKSKIAAVAAGTAVVALVGTGAMAYWTATGSGTGAASTSAGASNLVVTQTSTNAGLAPGVAASGITVTVQNQAANSAFVSQVVASIAGITGAAGSCDTGDYTLSNPIMTNGAGELAAGAVATFSGATIGFHDKDSNQDGCKGATVNLAYAVS